MSVTSFKEFGLSPEILRAVTEAGYTTPTPIQAQAIPVVLAGLDVMGGAQTGTGKTAGFALPILQRLQPYANTSPSPARHPVRALILAPTRELAIQVEEAIKEYGKYTGLALRAYSAAWTSSSSSPSSAPEWKSSSRRQAACSTTSSTRA